MFHLKGDISVCAHGVLYCRTFLKGLLLVLNVIIMFISFIHCSMIQKGQI